MCASDQTAAVAAATKLLVSSHKKLFTTLTAFFPLAAFLRAAAAPPASTVKEGADLGWEKKMRPHWKHPRLEAGWMYELDFTVELQFIQLRRTIHLAVFHP